jgi:Tfp pilus assembly protein PilO
MSNTTDISVLVKEKKIIVFFGLGLAITWIAFGPVLGKLRSRMAVRTKLTKENQVLTTKLEVLEGIDDSLVGQRVKKMEEVFPSKKPVVQLMGALNQLAAEHSLGFGGVTLRPGTLTEEKQETQKTTKKTKSKVTSGLADDLQDLSFGFQITGDFDDIEIFMNNLESLAPLMKIDELSLAIKSNPLLEGKSISVVADIEVLAYYQAPPETLGLISKSVELLGREDEAVMNRLFGFKSYEIVMPTAPTGKQDLFSTGLQEPL